MKNLKWLVFGLGLSFMALHGQRGTAVTPCQADCQSNYQQCQVTCSQNPCLISCDTELRACMSSCPS
jgi:hypothetical protein